MREGGKVFHEAHVGDGAGIVPGGEEIVAPGKTETFADVFESIGSGPTDLDGFLRESEDLFMLSVEFILREDPGDLRGHEVLGEHGVVVDFEGRENGGHGVKQELKG
jgi:hypothetical protein